MMSLLVKGNFDEGPILSSDGFDKGMSSMKISLKTKSLKTKKKSLRTTSTLNLMKLKQMKTILEMGVGVAYGVA